MRDLQARLSRLCADLALIEEELKKSTQKGSVQPIDNCNRRMLAEAKGAMDRVRHLLWPFVEAAAQKDAELDEVLQRYRMEQVTSLLNDLSERITEPRLAALPEAQSFFSSIQEIATSAVEKHLLRLTRQPADRALATINPKTLVN